MIWAGAPGVSVPNVMVMIADNDVPSLVVTETGNDTAVVEGGVRDTVLVALGPRRPLDLPLVRLDIGYHAVCGSLGDGC